MSSERIQSSTDTGFEGPRGRDEIRDAVLDAADILFTNRRPSHVSIREIAAVAGVNHALVHRHFDTKENLVREALERADTRMSRQWTHVAEPGEVTSLLLGNREMYHHALLMLEGAVMDGVTHRASSRLLDGPINRLKAERMNDLDATAASVTAVAPLLGWATYGEWLSAAAQATSEPERFESSVATALDTILQTGSR